MIPGKIFEWAALVITLILASLLRLHGLGYQSFWNDETATRITSVDPSLHFFEVEAPGENTPPPYFYVIKWWMKLFGSSDTWVRMPSALCGIASVLMVYLFGRRLAGGGSKGFLVGIFAALLLAMSRFHITYSQEARAYSIAFFLGTVSCYALAVLLSNRRPWAQWLYLISTVAMFWTHPCTLFLFVAQAIFILPSAALGLLDPKALPLRRWLVLFAIIVLCLSPWLDMAGYLANGGQQWMPTPTFRVAASDLLGTPVIWTAFAILGALSLVYIWRHKTAAPTLAILLAFLPVAVPILGSHGRHILFVPRYGIIALIGISITAGFGAASLGRIIGSLAVLAVCLLLSAPLIADYQAGLNGQIKPDLRGAAHQIEQMASPDDLVWCPGDLLNYPLTDYLSGSGIKMIAALPATGSPEAMSFRHIWMVLDRDSDYIPQERAVAGRAIGKAPYRIKQLWFRTGISVVELFPQNSPTSGP